jgi:hypothetical protein
VATNIAALYYSNETEIPLAQLEESDGCQRPWRRSLGSVNDAKPLTGKCGEASVACVARQRTKANRMSLAAWNSLGATWGGSIPVLGGYPSWTESHLLTRDGVSRIPGNKDKTLPPAPVPPSTSRLLPSPMSRSFCPSPHLNCLPLTPPLSTCRFAAGPQQRRLARVAYLFHIHSGRLHVNSHPFSRKHSGPISELRCIAGFLSCFRSVAAPRITVCFRPASGPSGT